MYDKQKLYKWFHLITESIGGSGVTSSVSVRSKLSKSSHEVRGGGIRWCVWTERGVNSGRLPKSEISFFSILSMLQHVLLWTRTGVNGHIEKNGLKKGRSNWSKVSATKELQGISIFPVRTEFQKYPKQENRSSRKKGVQ